jgi:hypothetical protein
MKTIGTLALLAGMAPALALAEAGLKIRHAGPSCLPTDRYAVITAEGDPAERVADAELQFRVDPAGGWYATRLAPESGRWTGLLPRATRPLPRLEYRIVMRTSRLETVTTDPVTLAVTETGCTAEARGSVADAIVVSVPQGAPLVPPVPPGFSPVGVTPVEEKHGSPRKALALGAAAAAAGGLAAFVSTREPLQGPDPLPTLPRFSYGGTVPATSQPLSVSRTALQVTVFLDRLPAFPFDMSWRYELMASGISGPCVSMSGFLSGVHVRNVTLQAPLVASGACPSAFTASGGRLVIEAGGEVRYDFTHNAPFRVEP